MAQGKASVVEEESLADVRGWPVLSAWLRRPLSAMLAGPGAVAVRPGGDLFIADTVDFTRWTRPE